MDPSPTAQPERRDHDSGRVAVPEIAELLHLQRPAAAVAAAAVVLFGLLVALVAPGVLPANVITGLVVGILALLAAAGTAVVLDGRDPVLRGPRHLRRDGHTVLARMAGPDPAQHGGPVLAAIERRLEGRDHLGIVLTGTGSDPSDLAVTLGRAAAADGHTALVIDLRVPGAPGVADVGEGTVRLGEAARLADDRPYAWIGAGVDREAAARAAAGVARRPPRDLKLLLVVAPDAATHIPEVLQACERTVLLVAADSQQRAMVTARLNALERAGGRPEAVVVGGLRVLADDTAALDDAATGPAPFAPSPTIASEPAQPDEPEPTAPSEPEPDAPPVTVPEPEALAPDATGDLADEPATVEPPHDAETPADATAVDDAEHSEHRHDSLVDTGPLPPVFRTAAPTAREATPSASTSGSGAAETAPAEHAPDELAPADDEPSDTAQPDRAQSDNGRSATAPVGDTSMDGMAETDPLMTVAALEQLVSQQRRGDAG